MGKKEKTATDNQWTSLPENSPEDSGYSHTKKEKTATDNQWTSTLKNSVDKK
ncbi:MULTISPECIES: hypothetical protein [Clostridium]|jgi:hypothetical protein|uniref:hypothetical protein n=1 Tax=Clostridium TaxID=1485 RepID=UPI000289B9C4|nr:MULTISPECIES: hypothetical protein [Clostridium]MDF2504457.1 hypothetical protein [Clostridium sp.]